MARKSKKNNKQGAFQYDQLKKAWLARHKKARKALHKKHKEALDYIVEKIPAKEQLASAAVGGLMLSSIVPATSSAALDSVSTLSPDMSHEVHVDRTEEFKGELGNLVPEKVRPLTIEEEANISAMLSKYFRMNINYQINGLRLNRTYGLIGAEQHLTRYPGDSMTGHLTPDEASNQFFYSSGMAPGKGAWGYFANSKAEFGEKDREREKWYIAVQTFEAPNYNGRLSDYRDFFKFRKMLIVNAKTGQAVVSDIADAGPAVWTGKHLGGSPEVMYFLNLHEGMRKGSVLYFFIDDPDDRIPLGPVNIT